MSRLDELIAELCPNGVAYESLGVLCNIETGKLNANAAVENGQYAFFTTAKEISRIDKYRWDTEALLIAGNANIGDVKHFNGKFEAYQRTYVLTHFSDRIIVKFLYYFLCNNLKLYLNSRKNEAAMTYIVLGTLQNFIVPIPPLPVQQEIVRILDSFTELTAELTAELAARKKQYEYYSNSVLKMKDAPVFKIKDVVKSISSGKNKERNDEGTYPVYGSTGIISYTNTPVYHGKQILIARVGANAGYVHIADGDYDVSDNTLIVDVKDNISLMFLYYLLKEMRLNRFAKGGGQPLVTAGQIKEIEIAVPSQEEQSRIANVLTKFDWIINDISSGLPAEINARQKQYEHYRDKLLAFKKIEVSA